MRHTNPVTLLEKLLSLCIQQNGIYVRVISFALPFLTACAKV